MNIDDGGRRWSRRHTAAVLSLVVVGGGAWFAATRTGDNAGAPSGAIATFEPRMETGTESAATQDATPAVGRTEVDPARLTPEVRAALAKVREESVNSKPVRHAVGRAVEGPVNQRSVKTAHGTIQLVSAEYDLTGQNMLGLAADNGKTVGNSHCTQRLKFSAESAGQVKPSVLLCWRTSADRSVATLAVAPDGRPSTAGSVAAIDKEWAALA